MVGFIGHESADIGIDVSIKIRDVRVFDFGTRIRVTRAIFQTAGLIRKMVIPT